MKAQVSTEFMVYAAILLLVMSFAAYFAIASSNDLRTESVSTDVKRLAALVASEINTAAGVGDGYSRRFFLPEYAYDLTNYTISVAQQRVYIFWDERSYSLPVLAENVTGNPAKGYNFIRNRDGAIFFE